MTTLNTVCQLIVEQFDLEPAKVTAQASLEELDIDSLSAIEFMFLLEDKFNVAAPEERVAMRTVQDVAFELDKLIAARDAGGANLRRAA